MRYSPEPIAEFAMPTATELRYLSPGNFWIKQYRQRLWLRSISSRHTAAGTQQHTAAHSKEG